MPQSAPELPSWVVPVSADTGLLRAQLAPQVANRPAALAETDYYVYPYFAPGGGQVTAPTFYVSSDANGYTAPVTIYVYLENRATGARQYVNINDGLLGFGVERDFFGTTDGSLTMYAPSFNDAIFIGAGGLWDTSVNADPTPTAIGQYMYVFQMRDASGTEVITEDAAMFNNVTEFVQVAGTINTDTVWTADKAYYLASAPVYVGGNGTQGEFVPTTLTIEPGTVVLGSFANQGTLVITRGSKLLAGGTAKLPIIFSSEFVRGQRAAGDWGGLVINGDAPVNEEGGEVDEGEGNSGPFGGDDVHHNGGVLRFVRVEFAGIRFSDRNELNGIALQGVGSGTVIDHVQVAWNLDDGIEFFGGTVNASNVFILGARDDSLDWVLGWNGRLDHVVCIQRGDDGDSTIEADNLSGGENNEPRSNPTIENATFIGRAGAPGVGNGSGARLRRGTAGKIRRAIFYNSGKSAIRINGDETYAQLDATNPENGELIIADSIFFNNAKDFDGDDPQMTEAWLTNPQAMNQFVDPMMLDPLNPIRPDIAPNEAGPAVSGASYIGGVNPQAPWIDALWISWSDN
jgi:hypothetical protein